MKLEAPGVPMFIQFKRSECLKRSSAKEIKAGARLDVPYYRMKITGKSDSFQHEMLVELDQSPNIVFYAAPMFHQKHEFDQAFLSGAVRQRSFFTRPQDIGHFSDDKEHCVSFDGGTCVVMSEPRVIEGLGIFEVESLLRDRLSEDKRPLREVADEAVLEASYARERLSKRIREKQSARQMIEDVFQEQIIKEVLPISAADTFIERQEANVPAIPTFSSVADSDMKSLQILADVGLREFNAQLYVVQES